MARAASAPLYVSRNHLEGSLCDVSLDRVLAACKRHLVTGVIRVHTGEDDGVLELRAGAIDHAQLGEASGPAALSVMRNSRDGWYEVAQRLPDLTGALGSAAQLEGEIDSVPLIVLLRHCEDHALTVTITVISGFDRACVEYRAGEITRVELNGFFDDDALPQILRWPDARFRIAAPPLDLDVEGWPVAKRAPTTPIHVAALPDAPRRLARGSGGTRFADASGEIDVPVLEPAVPARRERAVEVVTLPMFTSAATPARPRRRASSPGTLQTRPARRRNRHERAQTGRALSPAMAPDRRDAAWFLVSATLLLAVGLAALLFLA